MKKRLLHKQNMAGVNDVCSLLEEIYKYADILAMVAADR